MNIGLTQSVIAPTDYDPRASEVNQLIA